MTDHDPAAPGAFAERAVTVELFFDLVFVFTITGFAHVFAAAAGIGGHLLVVLPLAITWYIYSGYLWLSNNIGDGRKVRLALLAGMGGFLIMAVAVPDIFASSGLLFGLGYLYVTIIHIIAFARFGASGSRANMLRFTPFNLLAAAFVIAAGLTHGNAQTVFWALALVTILAITLIGVETGFALAPAHFVERHGLVIIIVLGEAVIAAGAAAEARLDDAATLLALLVSLTLIAGLWWSYFDHDDTDAEEAFTAAPPADRARLAFRGYFLGHLVMIVGLVLASTGIHEAIGGVGAPALTHGVAAKHASAAAHALKLWHVPAGIALYLAGDALFRLVFTLPQAGIRFLFAILAMLMALFADISGILLLAAVTALVIVMLLIEHALKTSRARKSREEAPSATAHIE